MKRINIEISSVPERLNLSGLHAEIRTAGSLEENELTLSLLRDGAGTVTGFYAEIPDTKDGSFIAPVLAAHNPLKTDEELKAEAPTVESLLRRLEALENG